MTYQNENGCSPLMIAITQKNEHVAIKLIDDKCDLNLQDKNGMTALMYAVVHNVHALIKKLVDSNCDLNIKNNYGDIAINYAYINNYAMNIIINKYIENKDVSFLENHEDKTSIMTFLCKNNLVDKIWKLYNDTITKTILMYI
ncbi:MAG: hypothetical protein Edafosvirus19_24 [Edafosvirus sp.]|uniref:Uncharacterized protein n=1 Tax=Edafosvirus sp. TaxID=2487765 RepID=A0A3G4ZUM7_9VIRU|nr:MAG: hypothetical protein Edafosvirus19_24 [Edafosvirus sp.]